MNFVFIVLVSIIGGTFVSMAVLTAIRAKRYRAGKRWLTAIGGILLALGGLGFFGSAFSAGGGLNWLPASFEWPIGHASGVETTKDGTHVVLHMASGRIQIYDQNWKFVRGWHVKAGGGAFRIRLTDADQIEVVTARGRMRYHYNLDGALLSQEKVDSQNYPGFADIGVSANVPTRWWLWMFTSPVYSWLVGAAGGILLALSSRIRSKPESILTA
jgi:hypothetical protein